MPAQLAADELTNADLAAQAEAAIRVLIHRTRRVGALGDPADVANLIAALAYLTSMLPQLLGQLADWLDHEYRAGHLRVDPEAPHPDVDRTLRVLTVTLQQAIDAQNEVAHDLDTAHQHAAHLATVPVTQQQPAQQRNRGQNSCRSVGPNHLTKRTRST